MLSKAYSSKHNIIPFPFEKINKEIVQHQAQIIILPVVRIEQGFNANYGKKRRKAS